MSCYTFITKLLHRNKIEAESEILENEMPPSETEIITSLKRLLEEKNHEIKLKEETISLLEKELDDKDVLIKHLQNEIDKFRQVVRPITQKIITKQINLGAEIWPRGGVENNKTQALSEPRIKRQAISAEPLNSQGNDLHITKIPKSASSRELIKAAILDNDFMKNLEITQIREIVDCMYPEEYKSESIIIREGDVGSTVYVLEDEQGNIRVRSEGGIRNAVYAPDVDEEILEAFERDPTMSIRKIERQLHVSKWKVWYVLRLYGKHPFHYTPVQGPEEGLYE
ncbi:cGMP-dependent protein kinase 1-like [Anoplophora glabripennis]|uniref:cGMP-dependent protein kinase 1-like n=1 Tax=Anoplophora glabripennis TaxID=217634 RepID=UPI0008756F26|nr:cGMP-dependent protein kinase 1-like [Anoplophora glabripennis]